MGMVKVTLREQLRSARSLAARQAGLLNRAQLMGFGVNDSGICRMLKRGNLVKLLLGVYRLPDARQDPLRAATAICLWSDDVVVSHRTAALHYLLDLGPVLTNGPVHVTRQSSGYVPSGYIARRTDFLEASDVLQRGAIRLTQPFRTLMDLAHEESEEMLGCAFESAWHRGLASPQRVRRYLDRLTLACGRLPNGAKPLRAWLEGAARRQRAMHSPLEVRCWLGARDEGFPPSQVQYRFDDGKGPTLFPDLVWERERVIVETRGAEAHASATKLRKNAQRDARLAAAGWTVIVVTWDMLEPPLRKKTMALIAAALEGRRRGLRRIA